MKQLGNGKIIKGKMISRYVFSVTRIVRITKSGSSWIALEITYYLFPIGYCHFSCHFLKTQGLAGTRKQ